MKQRPFTFFLLTFAIGWGVPGLALLAAACIEGLKVDISMYSPLYYLAVWSPALAALAMIGNTEGRRGLRAYAWRLLFWRVGFRWYALVLFGVPLLYLLAAILTWAAGEPALALHDGPVSAWLLTIVMRATLGPVEEFGWRGVALPLLQRRYTGLISAIVLGIIWGLWHAPTFFIQEAAPSMHGEGLPVWLNMSRFVLEVIAVSVIMTVVYNGTGGSIPLAYVTHWLFNFPYPWEGEADISTALALLLTIAAILLGGVFGRRYLGRQNLYTKVTGANESDAGRWSAIESR